MKIHTPAALPLEPGTFIARRFGRKEFTLIVSIIGTPPYLKGTVYDLGFGTVEELYISKIGEFAGRITGPSPLDALPDNEDRWKRKGDQGQDQITAAAN